MNAPDRFQLQQSRFIRAPREKVFDAFTDEAMLRQWHCPRGLSVPHSHSDARTGGAWQLQMLARDGSRFAVGGVYQELRRPERLVYTWAWQGENSPMDGVQTLVEVDFLERDGGTELRLRHSGFPAAAASDAHAAGWRSTLNRLVDLTDERGSAATLTLLGDPRSSYTRTARMALAEKGVAYTLQACAPHTLRDPGPPPLRPHPGLARRRDHAVRDQRHRALPGRSLRQRRHAAAGHAAGTCACASNGSAPSTAISTRRWCGAMCCSICFRAAATASPTAA